MYFIVVVVVVVIQQAYSLYNLMIIIIHKSIKSSVVNHYAATHTVLHFCTIHLYTVYSVYRLCLVFC